MTRDDFLEAELASSLRGPGCPVCVLARETERAVVSWLATTNIREEPTIAKLVEARGLCAIHWAGVLERRGGDLGPSGARVLSRIAAAAAEDFEAGRLTPCPPCPVCGSVGRRERSVLGLLFAALAEPRGLATYERSMGVCRRHLALALELAPAPRVVRALISVHRRSLRTLAVRARGAASEPGERSLAIGRIIALLAGPASRAPQLCNPASFGVRYPTAMERRPGRETRKAP